MKAAVVEKPGVLVARDVPDPVIGDYQCLCRMLYGATCTGTDQHIIGGRFPFGITYPTILGHESVGRVVEVGRKVRHFKVGDIVTRVGAMPSADGSLQSNWGGFAELGVAVDHRAMREDGRPEPEWRPWRIHQTVPAGIDLRAATMIITWRETLSTITRMGVGQGAAVLVIGSGGNGLSFVAHAANLGAAPVVMIGSAARSDLGRAAGADACFDYRADDLKEQIAEAFPEGFDFLIDAVGKVGQANRVLALLRPGGTVAVYGVDDLDDVGLNPWKSSGTFTVYNGGYDEAEAHDRVIAFAGQGRLKAGVWLDLDVAFPLVEIGAAFEAVRERRAVKVLVRLNTD